MPTARNLPSKPLVEAILEVRWGRTDLPPTAAIDPHYKVLIGRLFDRFEGSYPYHEQLPSAMVPDQLVRHIPQHRFRTAENQWPLVQVGPGLLTLNETSGYTWQTFKLQALEAIAILFDAHPEPTDFRLTSVLLRYVDAVDLPEGTNPVEFVREKLKSNVQLSPKLFDDGRVQSVPRTVDFKFIFPSSSPEGQISLQMRTAQQRGRPAIVWEVGLQSGGDGIDPQPDGFRDWLDSAHALLDSWFFELIDGELLEQFSKEP